jgi:hypothetical protein
LTHCGSAGITLECMDDDVTPGSCTSDAGCAAGWSCTRHAGESPEACGGSGACRETDALRHPICCGGGPCAPCEH